MFEDVRFLCDHFSCESEGVSHCPYDLSFASYKVSAKRRRTLAKAKAKAAAAPVLAVVPPAAALAVAPPMTAVAPPAAPEMVPLMLLPPPAPMLEARREEMRRALRGDRAVPFGRFYVLADVYRDGMLKSWSCRCFVHSSCNKTLTMSATIGNDEAKIRIMEWCVRGIDQPDTPGRRKNICIWTMSRKVIRQRS